MNKPVKFTLLFINFLLIFLIVFFLLWTLTAFITSFFKIELINNRIESAFYIEIFSGLALSFIMLFSSKARKIRSTHEGIGAYFLTTVLVFVVVGGAYILFEISTCCLSEEETRLHFAEAVRSNASHYYERHGKFPNKLEDIDPVLLQDFWGHENKYILEPQMLILISSGKDGVFGTKDDITAIENKANDHKK